MSRGFISKNRLNYFVMGSKFDKFALLNVPTLPFPTLFIFQYQTKPYAGGGDGRIERNGGDFLLKNKNGYCSGFAFETNELWLKSFSCTSDRDI